MPEEQDETITVHNNYLPQCSPYNSIAYSEQLSSADTEVLDKTSSLTEDSNTSNNITYEPGQFEL